MRQNSTSETSVYSGDDSSFFSYSASRVCGPASMLCEYTSVNKLSLGCLPDVLAGYLCKPEENIYSIDFIRFKIRDLETGTILFEIAKPPHAGSVNVPSPAAVSSCLFGFGFHRF